MGLQKSPRRADMSTGGLNRNRLAGDAQTGQGSRLDSDVSGRKFPGKPPKAGAGPKSPSVKTPANQAASRGRIATSGQARGGPQQMSDAVATPDAGTKAGRGRGKVGGGLR